MINSSNSIYIINSSLPQKVEVDFSNAIKLEKNPSPKTEDKELDKVSISENLDVKKENYRKNLEESQFSISFGQNAIKNIDEVQQNILEYKNADEKELKKEDFLKNIEKNINEVQNFSSDDKTVQSKAIGDFVNVLTDVKEKISTLDSKEENNFLDNVYKDVNSSKKEIENNIKSDFDSFQSEKEEYNINIKNKQTADDTMNGISNVIKGNPKHVEEIQKKAISGDTILALLKVI
jgi:hypothetical protein